MVRLILDDAKSINPEILYSELASNGDRVLENLAQFEYRDSSLEFGYCSLGELELHVRSPSMAQCDVWGIQIMVFGDN